MKWVDALKEYNARHGMWCVPKKGTKEHAEVMAIMNAHKAKKIESKPPAKKVEKMTRDVNKEIGEAIVKDIKYKKDVSRVEKFLKKAITKKLEKRWKPDTILDEQIELFQKFIVQANKAIKYVYDPDNYYKKLPEYIQKKMNATYVNTYGERKGAGVYYEMEKNFTDLMNDYEGSKMGNKILDYWSEQFIATYGTVFEDASYDFPKFLKTILKVIKTNKDAIIYKESVESEYPGAWFRDKAFYSFVKDLFVKKMYLNIETEFIDSEESEDSDDDYDFKPYKVEYILEIEGGESVNSQEATKTKTKKEKKEKKETKKKEEAQEKGLPQGKKNAITMSWKDIKSKFSHLTTRIQGKYPDDKMFKIWLARTNYHIEPVK